ncbi:excalibur calcium-binding domain-containing protein [Nocardioides halotolerans]|jgi:hypothetical protein|uniref:excalibur calcium-binding domain-containing protein n=1 Tax=Nocardioides halotolerans TaxID=433660 RepID=UPI0004287314|nr:excalibur calcium-binding domain-containing protein [Nocardioides halotolerans]
MMQRWGLASVALVVALAPFAGAPAEASGGIFDNCTAFNQKFPHGVGKKNAVDHTSGTPVTTFLRSNKKYATAMRKNDDLDRDGDKIACEKA